MFKHVMYVAGKTIPYYTGRKHYWFIPPKIPGYFGSFRQFRRIPVCFGGKLVPGRYKMNEFIFFPEYFWYLYIFIFRLLDDHDSPNFSLLDHPNFFFRLSTYQMVQADYPFSSCFHFSEQLPIFSTSLKDKDRKSVV